MEWNTKSPTSKLVHIRAKSAPTKNISMDLIVLNQAGLGAFEKCALMQIRKIARNHHQFWVAGIHALQHHILKNCWNPWLPNLPLENWSEYQKAEYSKRTVYFKTQTPIFLWHVVRVIIKKVTP